MKKTFLTTMVVSGLMLGSTAMAAPAFLETSNNSPYYIVSSVKNVCSSILGTQGITPPGKQRYDIAWGEVTSLCGQGSTSCTATIKYTANPHSLPPLCSDATAFAQLTINPATGAIISTTTLVAGWSITQDTSATCPSTDLCVTIQGPSSK